MAKIGFNDQWIEIAKVGKFADSTGVERDLNAAWMAKVVADYAASGHTAPAVIGHPTSDTAPAYGWVKEIRMNGDVLEAKFADTNEEFEKAIERGEYKKRSSSFYVDSPRLRHVGFLGAQPPAIKGLKDIQFADGESFAVESSIQFKETDMGLEDKDVEKVTEGVFEKIKNFFSKPEAGEAANFSEADVKRMITEAASEIETKVTEKVTAEFEEKIQELEAANEKLEGKIDGQSDGTTHAEHVAFAEAIPADRGRHFLKRAGIVEFMDSLAAADKADGENKAISFSEGEGDDKQDHKLTRVEWFKALVGNLPPVVSFGEKFGAINAGQASDDAINENRVESMKKAAGVNSKSGGAK